MTENATPTADQTSESETGATPPSGNPPGWSPHTSTRLLRSRSDRKLAGVAGGLGRYTGIDPLVFRIVLVVLAVFGGSGILLYALGWLIIPEEGRTQSEAQRLRAGRGTLRVGAAVALAIIGLIVFGATLDSHPGNSFGGLALLAVIAAGAYVVLGDDRPRSFRADPRNPGERPTSGSEEPIPPGAFGQTIGTAYVPPWTPSAPTAYAVAPPQPPRRERSVLGRLTFSAAALVVGVLLAVRVASPDAISFAGIPAAALCTVGVGLLVGAFYGRSRGLILLGVLLALLTGIGSAADAAAGDGVGTREWTPRTSADVRPEYRLGVGDATLDLRDVSPAAGEERSIRARVGMGDLLILVPADATLDIDAEARAGDVRMPDDTYYDGVGEGSHHFEDAGSASAGTIELDLRVGIGAVEVRRDAS